MTNYRHHDKPQILRHVRSERPQGFALVLSLMLLALLAATGAGVASLAATESLTTAYAGRDLDHELAIDSLLVILPRLMSSFENRPSAGESGDGKRRFHLTLAGCNLRCAIQAEDRKVLIDAESTPGHLRDQLTSLARERALPVEGIAPRPIVRKLREKPLPKFLWFDQLVKQTEFEEFFHWRIQQRRNVEDTVRSTWSDMVSFWGGQSGETLALEIQTAIGTDVRRWYVVATVTGDEVDVLFRGTI